MDGKTKLSDAQKAMIANGPNKIVLINVVNDTHARFTLNNENTKMTSGRWITSPPSDLDPLKDAQFYCDGTGAIFKVNSGMISYSYLTSSIKESKSHKTLNLLTSDVDDVVFVGDALLCLFCFRFLC